MLLGNWKSFLRRTMTELAFEAFFAIFEVMFFSTLLLVESFSISLSLKNELLNTVVVEIHFLV